MLPDPRTGVAVGPRPGSPQRDPRRRAALLRAAVAGVVACALITVAPSIVPASTKDRISEIRGQIDRAAEDFFDAQRKSAELDEQVADLKSRITTANRQTKRLRTVAQRRAVDLYTASGSGEVEFNPDDVLDAGRQLELIVSANADAMDSVDEYVAATNDARRALGELETRQREQANAVEALTQRRGDLETALDSARADLAAEQAAQAAREQAEAEARATAATTDTTDAAIGSGATDSTTDGTSPVTLPTTSPTSPATTPTTSDGTSPTIAPPTTTTTTPPNPGQHPHHNDPFLSCVRQRESRGIYTAVNPAGYYGAYQFAPSTWDATASHAGRLSLAGVRPDHAGVYDQDDMAWVLYQWQGMSPWGGHCP